MVMLTSAGLAVLVSGLASNGSSLPPPEAQAQAVRSTSETGREISWEELWVRPFLDAGARPVAVEGSTFCAELSSGTGNCYGVEIVGGAVADLGAPACGTVTGDAALTAEIAVRDECRDSSGTVDIAVLDTVPRDDVEVRHMPTLGREFDSLAAFFSGPWVAAEGARPSASRPQVLWPDAEVELNIGLFVRDTWDAVASNPEAFRLVGADGGTAEHAWCEEQWSVRVQLVGGTVNASATVEVDASGHTFRSAVFETVDPKTVASIELFAIRDQQGATRQVTPIVLDEQDRWVLGAPIVWSTVTDAAVVVDSGGYVSAAGCGQEGEERRGTVHAEVAGVSAQLDVLAICGAPTPPDTDPRPPLRDTGTPPAPAKNAEPAGEGGQGCTLGAACPSPTGALGLLLVVAGWAVRRRRIGGARRHATAASTR